MGVERKSLDCRTAAMFTLGNYRAVIVLSITSQRLCVCVYIHTAHIIFLLCYYFSSSFISFLSLSYQLFYSVLDFVFCFSSSLFSIFHFNLLILSFLTSSLFSFLFSFLILSSFSFPLLFYLLLPIFYFFSFSSFYFFISRFLISLFLISFLFFFLLNLLLTAYLSIFFFSILLLYFYAFSLLYFSLTFSFTSPPSFQLSWIKVCFYENIVNFDLPQLTAIH